MSFAQGRYGIMYHPTGGPRPRPKSPGRWVAAVLALALIGYGSYRLVKRFKGPAESPQDDPAPVIAVAPPETPIEKAAPPPRKKPAPPAAAQPAAVQTAELTTADVAPSKKGRVLEVKPPTVVIKPPTILRPSTEQTSPLAPWLKKALETADSDRPAMERQQLLRLAQAEREKKSALAVDAIEKLYTRPAMNDLQSDLVQRLGELNMQRLRSETNTPWTVMVTIQRGDTLDRLSREHKTTMAATRMLNPKLDPNRLKIGMAVRLLNYPNAVLVVHKKLDTADLFLKNGSKLFKRYALKVGDKAAPGSYPVSSESGATLLARFAQFALKASAADRKELETFLAPGSRITVTDQ